MVRHMSVLVILVAYSLTQDDYGDDEYDDDDDDDDNVDYHHHPHRCHLPFPMNH